jgi:GAF domain-containing protein/HAMP domain-containing protein
MSQTNSKSNWLAAWFSRKQSQGRVLHQIRSSVSNKLISAVVVILVIIAGFQVLYSDRATRQNLEQEAEDVLVSYYQTYQTQIEAESRAAESLAISIAARKDVQELYLSGNRDELYNLLSPMFTQWKDRQVVHLYIENPDGTVFLRVHNPANFGDDITYRGTAKTALVEQRPTSGVEIGPSRLGVRGVAPMYSSDGQFIGLTEVGVDFDEGFIENLKKTTHAEFSIWILHEAAATPNLKPVDGVPAAPIEELFYYAGTNPEALPVSPDLYRSVLETGTPAFQLVTRNASIPSTVYITPLLGYSGKLLGLLQISESYTDHLEKQNSAVLTAVGVTAGLAILGLFLIWLFSSRIIIQPLKLLSQFADRQMAGETGSRVSVTSGDEFQQLAKTFNALADSVEEQRMNLERRVAERTQSLELAAEVGRSVSQVRALDVMLKDAVEIIRSQFDLYYAQVYLTDPGHRNLILQSGTGDVGAQLVGRGHRLPLDTGSINGRAAVEKRPAIVSDTAASSTFRPNPLLPETRSEMAIPLLVGEKVVGVLDLQSKQAGALSQEILPAFEALAGQLAIAIQNAKLLEEAQQAQAEVEVQARRLVRVGWDEHLDAIHKPEQIGFVFNRKEITPLVDATASQLPEDTKAISVPITVTGEALRAMAVEIDDETGRERTIALVNSVAQQVAQQIENLRLLESAERYRYEAEKVARLQTIEGWQKYIEARSEENLAYLYDTKEVRPHVQSTGQGEDLPMFALPLKARDAMIGKLSVQGLTKDDQESAELLNAVAERLSAHIENLRLFEETRLGQLELDQRARQLSAVANISTASSQELEVEKLLNTVVRLTQRQFGLYHAHIFIYREATQELQITACGWKEGDPHEGTHEAVSIALNKEQSLVARAARTRQAVIVNDVHKEPGWLPNPLLPDTASEMAVPLMIGEQLLGVLDVQADRLNAFTEQDANIQATLAAQVATSLQNARSFARAQKQAERESMLNAISQKIQSATTVEAVLQIAARELGHALRVPLTVAQLGAKSHGNSSGNGNGNGNGQHHPATD